MLSAGEIRAKTFETSKYGFDTAEVAEFLKQAAAALEAAEAKNKESEEKIVALVEKINEYRADEDAIKDALLTAQKEANKILSNAKTEARDMIESAKSEQIRISEESASECERIVREHKEKCAALIKENTEETEKKILQVRDDYANEKEKYDNLRAEVTYFKANLTELYRNQLQLIMDIPVMEEEELSDYEDQADEEDQSYEGEDAFEQVEEVYEEYTQSEANEDENAQKLDEILNTGSIEPVIPKNDVNELRFGMNN